MKKQLKITSLLLSSILCMSLSACSTKTNNSGSNSSVESNSIEVEGKNYVYSTVRNGGQSVLCSYNATDGTMNEHVDSDNLYDHALVYGQDLFYAQDTVNEQDYLFKIGTDLSLTKLGEYSEFSDILDKQDKYVLMFDYENNNIMLKSVNDTSVEDVFSTQITKDDSSVSGAIDIANSKIYLCYRDETKTILDTYDFSGKLVESIDAASYKSIMNVKYQNGKVFLLETMIYDNEKSEYTESNNVYLKENDNINSIIKSDESPSDLIYIENKKEYMLVTYGTCDEVSIYDENFTFTSKIEISSDLAYGSYLRYALVDDRVVLLFDQGEAIDIDTNTNEFKKIELQVEEDN